MSCLEYISTDKFIYENEIRPYLPSRIFDAHVHLQIPQFHPHLEEQLPLTKAPLFNQIDMAAIHSWWKTLFPAIDVRGLILAMPTAGCDMSGINKFNSQHIDSHRERFSILTGPQFSDNELEEQVKTLKPHGLKPYMFFSMLENYNDSRITDFLPESQIAIADKYGLSITLHLAKTRGLADKVNLNEINRLVKSYPNVNFILAHCGRCFIAPNMDAALEQLIVAPNLWLDTSAVCDTGVFLHLFSRYDRKQILFGTDLVTASGFRGTYVRMGMSWDWSVESSVRRQGGQDVRATFAVYENLCAIMTAARFCCFDMSEYNDLFYANANRIFQLEQK
ncbi:MAG: hypothetical protein A2Y12_13540 [Planctomycetes bacterium GWF2_42_9]|nr:MAG: hypothetical protein A2Y12_13540 [Planctomycetes bacterium GWF2_42_9]